GKPLKAFTNLYPVIIIDAGSELNELALKALENSTMIITIVSPDLLAVNQTKRLYSNLITMLFPKDMIQIVVNQFQKGHPVSAEVIGKQIGKPVFGVVAKDDQNCARGLSTSTPVLSFAKNSPFAQGVIETV